MVHYFFDKKSIKDENTSNKELAEESRKPIIGNFNKSKVNSYFINNICVADLWDMRLISEFNKGFRFRFIMSYWFYTKHEWVITLKDKKGITIITGITGITRYYFSKQLLDESSYKANKKQEDKDSKFYNRPMKSWLGKNDKETYWQYNAGKSAIAGSFIKTLKNKNYKYMTSVSKNVYIDKLDDIIDKYNDKYHSTIKMLLK